MNLVTRRQMLATLGVTAGACALSCSRDSLSKSHTGNDNKPASAWKYSRLSGDDIAQQAYDDTAKGHCMYGVFAPVMQQLGEKYGEPYRSFPVEMMAYGAGGTGGWGTLCGALNGGAALAGLFVRDETQQKQLISKLFKWYETAELPMFQPAKPVVKMAVPVSVSNSVLCHASVSNWCKVSGKKAFSKERKERCKRLTADVARKTVSLLNAHFAALPGTAPTTPPKSTGCAACHTAKDSTIQNSRGKMSCNPCHTMPDKHPEI